MKELHQRTQNTGEVFDEQAKRKRKKRRYYRNLILTFVTSFSIGLILKAFFDVFGLSAALFGVLLCLLSFGLAHLLR